MRYVIIKSIIDSWDPVELLNFAPSDEYDEESKQIYLCYSENINELGSVIFCIFKKAFDNTFSKSIDDCIVIAQRIIDDDKLSNLNKQ